MIHGIRTGLGWLGRLQRLVDWTNGCIAATDPRLAAYGDVDEANSTIGVVIGVMTLNIVLAVFTGYEEDLRDRILAKIKAGELRAPGRVVARLEGAVIGLRAVAVRGSSPLDGARDDVR